MRFLIRYHGLNIHRISVATGEYGKEEKRPILNRGMTSKRFLPGINVITLDEWKDIKDSPAFKNLIAERQLTWEGANPETVKADAKEAKGDADSILSGLSPDQALSVVEETFDMDLLMSWREKEPRRPVLHAIEKQIDTITVTEKDYDGKVERKKKR